MTPQQIIASVAVEVPDVRKGPGIVDAGISVDICSEAGPVRLPFRERAIVVAEDDIAATVTVEIARARHMPSRIDRAAHVSVVR